LTTFGQRITKAWENFKKIKPKEDEEMKKDENERMKRNLK